MKYEGTLERHINSTVAVFVGGKPQVDGVYNQHQSVH